MGLMQLYSGGSNNNSHAIVRQSIDTPERKTGKKLAKFGAMVATVASIGSLLTGSAMPPQMKRNVVFGSLGAAAFFNQLGNSSDPGAAVLAGTLTAVAGLAVFSGVKAGIGPGTKVFKDFLNNNGKEELLSGITNAIANAKKNFPLLNSILSEEAAAMGFSIASVPAAHSLTQKIISRYRRRMSDHADTSFIPSTLNNTAGTVSGQRNNGPIIAHPYGAGVNYNLSGSIKSHYNPSQALGAL